MRKPIILGLLASAVAAAAVTAMPASGKAPGERPDRVRLFDPALDGKVTYTANPDGSHMEQLFSAAPLRGAPLVAGRQRGRHPRPLHGRPRQLRGDDRGSGQREVPAAPDVRPRPLHRLPPVVAGRRATRLRGLRRIGLEPERHLHDPRLRRRWPDADDLQSWKARTFLASSRRRANALSLLAPTRMAFRSACTSSRPTAAICGGSRLQGRSSVRPATGRRRTRSYSRGA